MRNLLTLVLCAAALSAQKIDWPSQIKNKPFFDVRDYGAKCNGTFDDTAGVQAALNAAKAAGGGRVALPSGSTCKWSTVSVTDGGGVWLDGGSTGQLYGSGSRVILTTGSGNNAVLFSGQGFATTHNRLSNIQFDASGASTSMDYAVKITGQQQFYLDHVSIYSAPFGVLIDQCYYCHADYLDILGLKAQTGIGVGISGWGILWASHWLINGSNDPNCGYTCEPSVGVVVTRHGGFHLSQADIEHSGRCMLFSPGQNQVVEFARITDVFCDQNSTAGFEIIPTHASAVVHGMEFNHVWSATSGGSGFLIGSGTGTVDGVAINDSQIVNNMGNGVDINHASNVTLSNNRITKNNRQASGTVNTSGTTATWVSGGPWGNVLGGNTITINGVPYTVVSVATDTLSMTLATSAGTQTGATWSTGNAVGCGVHIAASQNNIQIKQNIIGTIDYFDANIPTEPMNTQTYGICQDLGGSGDYIEITGNTLVDNVTAGLTFSSTGTHNVVKDNLGYNPVGASAISVTASPFTYTAGPSPETVYIIGGTVSSVARGAVVVCSASPCAVNLPPNGAVAVTYTVAPTMNKDVH